MHIVIAHLDGEVDVTLCASAAVADAVARRERRRIARVVGAGARALAGDGGAYVVVEEHAALVAGDLRGGV